MMSGIVLSVLVIAALSTPNFRGSSYFRSEVAEEVLGRIIIGVALLAVIWIVVAIF